MRPGAKLLLGALVAGGALWLFVLSTRGPRTPGAILSAVQAKLARGETDDQALLGELGSLVGLAQSSGEVEVAARARLLRGKLLLELGALEVAREDLFACLDHAPQDFEVRALLVELEARSGALDQAIVRAHALAREDPARESSWTRLGELFEERAARRLTTCQASIRRALVRESELRAKALLEEGAAVDRDDPRRRVLQLELGELFTSASQEGLQEARRAMDEAGDDLASARAAYASTLEQAGSPRAAGRLLALLERAGRDDDLLDVGIAALRRPELRRSPDVLAPLMRTLDERGRHAFASEVATWITQEGLPADGDLIESCAWIHLRAGQWNRVPPAANGLKVHGSIAQKHLVEFLLGWSLTRQGLHEPWVLHALRRWLRERERESYPGMRADAWLAVCEQLEALGGEAWERRDALEAYLREAPRRDGERWLELAELYASERHGGYRPPEERFARGISLCPGRAAELMPRWRELGELELAAEAFDPVLAHQAMVTNSSWTPSAELSPYQLWRLMEVQAERNDLERALASARALLELLPGFLPALDQAIPFALRLERSIEAAELLLARMEVIGHDERSAAWLRALPPELLDGKDRLRMMRAAPESIGRTVLARSLLEKGRGPQVLAVLGELSSMQEDPELRRLAARVALELGEPERAALLVDGLLLAPRRRADDLALVVGLELAAGEEGRLAKLVGELDREQLADNAELWTTALESFDRLLAAGRAELAAGLIALLDEVGRERGLVLVRKALAELALGRALPARAALDRAEAFERSGRAALVRLALEHEREGAFETAMGELAASRYPTTPVQETALLLLSGKVREARERASHQPSARSPASALLLAACQAAAGEELSLPASFGPGAAAAARALLLDPAARRRLLVLLVAREDPVLEPWAAYRLGRLARAEANPWVGLLALVTARDPALLARRRSALEALLEDEPGFGPAREELARLARELGQAPEELGLDGDGGPVAQAAAARLAGNPRRAIQILQGIREEAADRADVHRRLGELYADLGLLQQALDSYVASLEPPLGARASQALGELLELFPRARARGVLEQTRERELLARFEERFPDDPAVALARARNELASDPRNPSLSLARAYTVLERFRQRHAERALDELRPGAAEAWTRFQLELDPRRARAFAEAELALQPGSLELWILFGEALAAEGRAREAHAHFTLVERLAPREARVQRALLALESQGLASREEVNARAGALRELEGGARATTDEGAPAAPDAEIAFWRANALFLGGPRTLAGAAARFEVVWREQHALPSSLPRERVAQRYAAALIAASGEQDSELARTLAAGLAARNDVPYRRDVARAMGGLAVGGRGAE